MVSVLRHYSTFASLLPEQALRDMLGHYSGQILRSLPTKQQPTFQYLS